MPDTSADHESPTIICDGKQKDGTSCLSELTTGHHFCSKCGKEAPLTRTGMDKGVMYNFLMQIHLLNMSAVQLSMMK